MEMLILKKVKQPEPEVKTFQKPNMGKDYVESLSVVVNPQDNGGQAVTVEVDVFDNGDEKDAIYTCTSLKVQCYETHTTVLSFWSVGLSDLSSAFDMLKDRVKWREDSRK